MVGVKGIRVEKKDEDKKISINEGDVFFPHFVALFFPTRFLFHPLATAWSKENGAEYAALPEKPRTRVFTRKMYVEGRRELRRRGG